MLSISSKITSHVSKTVKLVLTVQCVRPKLLKAVTVSIINCKPIDEKGPILDNKCVFIHGNTPEFVGNFVKVADSFTSHAKGGIIDPFGGAGVDKTTKLLNVAEVLCSYPVFTGVPLVLSRSYSTNNYEILYRKEKEDHKETKDLLRTEIEARKEAEVKLVHVQGLLAAVASRSALDKVFLEKVKAFLPIKESGKNYTGAQIRKAYIKFLKTNDEFAIALKTKYPNVTNKQIAKQIAKIYGLLSCLDHALFDILRMVYTAEKILEVVQFIPAVLTPDQVEFVRNFIVIYFEISGDSESDEDTDSEDENKDV